EQDFDRDRAARDRDTQQKLAGIEADRQRRQADIEQQRTGTLGILEQDRERAQAERRRRFEQDLEASGDALARARKEWEDALAEAAQKRAEVEAQGGPARMQRAEMDLSDLDELLN